jgi:hypothetical protein
MSACHSSLIEVDIAVLSYLHESDDIIPFFIRCKETVRMMQVLGGQRRS